MAHCSLALISPVYGCTCILVPTAHAPLCCPAVPRTAGRTFSACFLKLGTPPSKRCPKAYDHLRMDPAAPHCTMLSSHDDFSIVSMLPDDVSVLSHFRDPIDRFLSAYEFAIGVASRRLKAKKPAPAHKNPNFMATEDVWPWSHLLPWFTQDMLQRVRWVQDAMSAASWVG